MTTTSKRTFLLGTPLLIKMQSYVRLIYLRSYVKFCAIEPTGCLIISWWRSSGYIYCTIWTICSWVVTCDAKCSLPEVFIKCRDLWHEKKKKVFISEGVHTFSRGPQKFTKTKDSILILDAPLSQFRRCSEPAMTRDYVPSVQFIWACDVWHEHLVEIVQ